MRLRSPPLQGEGWVGMGFRRAGNDADFTGCAADAPSLDGWRTWVAAPVPTAQRCSPDGRGPRFGAGFAVSLDPLRSPLCSHRTRPRSDDTTADLQYIMRTSYAVLHLKK